MDKPTDIVRAKHGWLGLPDHAKVECQVLVTMMDMTTTAADAHKEISKNTFAVPARQETVRTAIVAVGFIGSLFVVRSTLTSPWAVAGLMSVAVIAWAALAIVKLVKSKT